MSAAFYRAKAAKAAARIRKFGRAAVLLRRGDELTGPDEPHRPNRDEPARLDIFLLQTDNTISNDRNTVVQKDDVFGIIPVGENEPDELRDQLDDGGRIYTFVKVKPLKLGEATVYYEYHARV